MKSFKEFLNEDAVKAQQAWQDWMNQNPHEFRRGGRFYEKGGGAKVSQVSKDFMKTYMKTGKPPEGFELKTTKVSSANVGFGGRSTQATPKPSPKPPQQPAGASPPPPPKTPQQPPQSSTPPKPQKSGGLVGSTEKAAAAAKPGLRTRLGSLVGPAATVATGVMDYKARREVGQSRARAAGGAVASGAGWAKGAQMGASLASKLPIPNPIAKAAVIGAGGLAGGIAGDTAASAAYDYAANKSRPARQAVAKATGFDKFQQKQAAFKPGSGLSGLAKAQQTVDTRGARQVAAKAGTYGARQGSALTGVGGSTTVNRQAGTLTSGGKTAKLSSTQLVRDPKTGQQRVGDLAYKGGKAVYLARPSIQSRDTSLAARVGRALNIGRYSKAAETQAAKQEYRTALKGTQQYQKQLGITPKAAAAQKLPGR